MRIKRLEKFRRYRNEKRRKFFLFVVVLPGVSVFIGYIITSLFILPSIVK